MPSPNFKPSPEHSAKAHDRTQTPQATAAASASRRRFLSTVAAGATATASLTIGDSSRIAIAARDEGKVAGSTSDGTWLTYAVNVEMTWTNLPFLDRLRKVSEAGFSHYEFWPWRNKDIDAIRSLNQELGLTPVQFTASPKRFDQGITDPSPARLEEFVADVRAAVEVAKKLGVRKLCVVAGEETRGQDRDEQTRAVITALKAGAKVVEPEGITLILEPLNILVDHPRQLIVTSEQAASVIRAVGSPNVKILFDIYHQQISEGNLSGNIRAYHDLIGYYQLADHPGRHQPTTGEINYPFILKTIHDVGYRGAIGMEMSPQGDPAVAFRAMRQVDTAARALAESSHS
jgi:hydroxypyruvate isomerase